MDTTELTRALRDATEDIEPRRDFTDAVLRGGKRRKARNRVVLITGTTAVLALVASGTYLVWPDSHPSVNQAADPRLSQPTGGDLAGDTAFVNAAARAWREGLPRSWNASRGIFDDLRGAPHVYWAGSTAAGPAAVVMQRAYLHPHGNLSPSDFDQYQTLVGLVAKDPADGALRLVYDQYQPDAFAPAGYFQFGPGDRTVVVVDRGLQLYFSPAPVTGPDGRVTRDWQPLTISDGVAMASAPEGTDPRDLRVLARQSPPAPDDKSGDGLLLLEPTSGYLKYVKEGPNNGNGLRDETRLQWFADEARIMRTGRPYDKLPADPSELWMESLDRAGVADIGPRSAAWGLWHVLAGLPDGRAALVSEISYDNKPSRIYAVLLKPDGTLDRVIPGDVADRSHILPVRLRLPDAQGWVVANYGAALAYRTGPTDSWHPADRSAALLPDNATQVQVTIGATGPAVVNLTS